MYKAFLTAANPADRAVGPLSPLPCQAWRGYGVSNAYHGEVRGCQRACERTPLRGRCRCAAGGRRAWPQRVGKAGVIIWDRKFRAVQFCDRGSCEKKDVGWRVWGWFSHAWNAMELLAGMHLTRKLGADVAYGNTRRKNNTLKIIVPPGTVTKTTRQQHHCVITSQLTFKFSTARVVITTDPPSTCRPKLSAAHPLLTGPEDADFSRYPHLPVWDCN
jgi:hypothetical protein